ncbi:MAG: hypothetical protein RLZZ36_44, partial [Pseudomonadota bacterium]
MMLAPVQRIGRVGVFLGRLLL